jgi:ribosomal protein S18 acetylase RimI-like enzyme
VGFASVEENLRQSFRVVAASRPSGEIRELPGVTIASAGVTFQMFNAAFLSRPVASEEEFAERVIEADTHFASRRQQWAYWICEGWLNRKVLRRVPQVLSHRRLRHSVVLPGMVAERLQPPARPLPRMETRRVGDQSTRDAFCALGSLCFNVPLPWFREVFGSASIWQDFEAWVGYVRGEPVTTVAVIASSDALGLYNVATTPGRQRRGYAESLIRCALEAARERHGFERVVLQSTSAGFRLYERMGFRTVTKVSVYSS